jgi:hypothetical protein
VSGRSTTPLSYGTCRFCSREDVVLTREHVFARWLVERLRAWRATHIARGPGNAAADARIARLVTNVCGACNAGWMSQLEVSFRQAVFAKSRPDHVAEPTRRTLSRWFAKTATLVAHVTSQELVPEDQWPALADAMPGGIRVGLARMRRKRQPLDVELEYAAPDGTDPTGKLTSVAVQVDDLVAIVTRQSSVTPATTLWPIRSHVLRWTTLPVVNRLSDLTGGEATPSVVQRRHNSVL